MSRNIESIIIEMSIKTFLDKIVDYDDLCLFLTSKYNTYMFDSIVIHTMFFNMGLITIQDFKLESDHRFDTEFTYGFFISKIWEYEEDEDYVYLCHTLTDYYNQKLSDFIDDNKRDYYCSLECRRTCLELIQGGTHLSKLAIEKLFPLSYFH